ncbi:MAG: glutamate mutase L [Rhodospirillales bacterium]|nr:glutamate mutase L [Rhodospirillales bacterium]
MRREAVNAIALVDFGSTFTKLTITEAGTGRLLARAQAPTTVETDVMEGYRDALGRALAQAPGKPRIVRRLAASSAGGGLRVAAIGLVPEYTEAAARQAALNAGARIVLQLSGRLDESAVARLEEAQPEIVLFSGGTDGGQREQVLENAEAVSAARIESRIVVACNRDVAGAVADMLAPAKRVRVVANVLPAIGHLDIEPARAAIHDEFIRHVIRGKGLSRAEEFHAAVIMPTPEAVLRATRLLAEGPDETTPTDVVVIDLGGATTDVHAAVALKPAPVGIRVAGLPALPLRRTVEGDLGMRWSAPGVLEADGDWLEAQVHAAAKSSDELRQACARRRREPGYLPDDPDEERIDRALATACVTHALQRHCGTLKTVYVPGQGADFEQRGADLRDVPLVIGTGGVLGRQAKGEAVLRAALERQAHGALTPRAPALALDRRYVLAAAGLLSTVDENGARALLADQGLARQPSGSLRPRRPAERP